MEFNELIYELELWEKIYPGLIKLRHDVQQMTCCQNHKWVCFCYWLDFKSGITMNEKDKYRIFDLAKEIFQHSEAA